MTAKRPELKAAILAAGLGQRMAPLTAHLPKPLFPLVGKVPISEVWVRKLVEFGISDISMNLCVHADKIRQHFKDGTSFGANINYVVEKTPSGTLGGVCKQALGAEAKSYSSEGIQPTHKPFKGSTIIAPSGDIITNFGPELLAQMFQIHKRAGAAFTIALVPVSWDKRKDFGMAVLENPETDPGLLSKAGRIKEFIEKDPDAPSNLNNASIYMIEMELLRELDELRTEARLDVSNPFYDFGKHVFPALLGKLPYVSLKKDYQLWGVQYDGAWFDVGQKRDYLKVNEDLLDGSLEIEVPYEKQPWGYLGSDTQFDAGKVEIIPPVIIGDGCVIEPGAVLGPYATIGDRWVIREQARIENSILWGEDSMRADDDLEITAKLPEAAIGREIGPGVVVQHSIITAGNLHTNVRNNTVDIGEDGELRILPFDSVPTEPRP